MKRILLLLSMTFAISSQAQVVINEVDCDQIGTDAAEFVELIGEPNTSLDGLVVVFFNGSSDLSYNVFDLDGFTTDANGLFVLGNPGVNGVVIEFPGNGLQNGADGVAIYVGDATSFPMDTPATAANLIDAVVYGTADPEDTGLIAILTPGQIQVDESSTGNSTTSANARVPDGGDAFDISNYVTQDPTPGAFNAGAAPLCVAGDVFGTEDATTLTSCSDVDEDTFPFFNNSVLPATNYWYAITDANGNVIALTETGSFDFDSFDIGEYHVYGFTFSGNIVGEWLGQPVDQLTSDDCSDVSESFVLVQVIDCTLPTCEGGTLVSSSLNYTFCDDASEQMISFSFEGNSQDGQLTTGLLTDENNLIVGFIEGGTVDMSTYGTGNYRVWGLTYFADLDPTTIEPGDNATQILTSGACLALTSNYIAITVVECIFENPCQSLIISEYFEGTGFNKAIELYNTTNFPIDLDAYEVFLYANGAVDYTSAFAPLGILNGGETFLIVHPQADQALLDMADTLSTVTNFNGDDAVVLTENLETIDVIGEVGVDPGTEWSVGSGATANYTLIRYDYVTAGNASWSVCQNQYYVAESNAFTTLGNHSFLPCSSIPQLGFVASAASVAEGVGIVAVEIIAYNIPEAVELTLDFADGTAVSTEDYVNAGPVIVSFPAGNSIQIVNVDITNDEIEEDLAEYFILMLSSAVEVDLITPEMTITIEPNDQSYPVYDIEQVTVSTTAGVLDSLEVYCELRGIVHGINFNAAGVHFHLIDETDGIRVFSADQNFGYTVTEGDSVHVGGYIDQFNGQSEIRPNYITLIDGGHELETPTVVTSLSEANESHLVTFECIRVSNPGSWTSFGTYFMVNTDDGTNSIPVRIDGDTEIFPNDVIEGHFTLTGIVEQDDDSSPFDGGYFIQPRYYADVTEQVVASFTMPDPLVYGDNGVNVEFINNSTGGVSYDWAFGDGNTFSGELSTYEYSYDFLSGVADVAVSLTVTNEFGCADVSTQAVDVVYSSVVELNNVAITVFPNPTQERLFINADQVIGSIEVMDATGRVVMRDQNVNRLITELDVASLTSGIYMVRVVGSGFEGSLRFIKQ
jgi:hypothetical protein